jgi:hypothetical protein
LETAFRVDFAAGLRGRLFLTAILFAAVFFAGALFLVAISRSSFGAIMF